MPRRDNRLTGAAVLSLLLPLYAGTRIAEIAALDVADVRLSARKGEIHLVGKDEKSRTVPVHPKRGAGRLARRASRQARRGPGRPVHLEPGHQDDHRRHRRRHRGDHHRRRDGRPCDQPHPAAHLGTELTRRGVDLVTVAELMGHASLETTRLYTRPSAADMQQAVDLLTVDE